MRRGFMSWTPEEVPAELLAERVAQVAGECRARGLAALVQYSNFTRPLGISALTHFVPFWSQAMLAVTASGRSVLSMATTGRTVQWIRSTACVDEVLVGGDIGASVGRRLSELLGERIGPIGIAYPQDIPQAALDSLRAHTQQAQQLDASAWWDACLPGFAPTAAVVAGARQIARAGLMAMVEQAHADANAVVAAVDGRCRGLGAEEVAVLCAPDLDRDAGLRRLEGAAPLGPRFAVQLSLAYKGHWLRMTSSFERTQGLPVEAAACQQAGQALEEAVAQGASPQAAAAAVASATGARLDDWWLEGRRAGLPLDCLAAADLDHRLTTVPAEASFGLRLHGPAGSWLFGQPTAGTSSTPP